MKTFYEEYRQWDKEGNTQQARAWLENLTQEQIQELWEYFGDTPVYDSDAVKEMIENGDYDLSTEGMEDDSLDEDFLIWPRGTERTEVWQWFDEHLEMPLGQFMEEGAPTVKAFPGVRTILLSAARISEDALDQAIYRVLTHAYEMAEQERLALREQHCYDDPKVESMGDMA